MAVEVYKNIETYKPEDVEDVVVETDILIIGGGFSGLYVSIFLYTSTAIQNTSKTIKQIRSSS